MTHFAFAVLISFGLLHAQSALSSPRSDQLSIEAIHVAPTTIALFRHAETPTGGLGMLSCKGLNRSLALPRALADLVGQPDIAIAPNPSQRKLDDGVPYDYNRALLTLAPSAVASAIPMEADLQWSDHQGLAQTLISERLAGKVVYVAGDGDTLLASIRDLFSALRAPAPNIPTHWSLNDFDSLYVITIHGSGDSSRPKVGIRRAHQRLDGLSEQCLGAARAQP